MVVFVYVIILRSVSAACMSASVIFISFIHWILKLSGTDVFMLLDSFFMALIFTWWSACLFLYSSVCAFVHLK